MQGIRSHDPLPSQGTLSRHAVHGGNARQVAPWPQPVEAGPSFSFPLEGERRGEERERRAPRPWRRGARGISALNVVLNENGRNGASPLFLPRHWPLGQPLPRSGEAASVSLVRSPSGRSEDWLGDSWSRTGLNSGLAVANRPASHKLCTHTPPVLGNETTGWPVLSDAARSDSDLHLRAWLS